MVKIFFLRKVKYSSLWRCVCDSWKRCDKGAMVVPRLVPVGCGDGALPLAARGRYVPTGPGWARPAQDDTHSPSPPKEFWAQSLEATAPGSFQVLQLKAPAQPAPASSATHPPSGSDPLEGSSGPGTGPVQTSAVSALPVGLQDTLSALTTSVPRSWHSARSADPWGAALSQ